MKKYRQLIKELPSKKVVFAFGRFQPPTTGHELLVKAVQKVASAQGADHVIYASKTEDKKQNPLPVSRKVYYLQRMFPGANFKAANEQVRTFIEAAKELNKRYKNIVMVAGSDRIAEYKKILEKYNGTEFNFDTVTVVSAGERDPDSDNATGMSGTKMREAAKAGKFSQFKKGVPKTLTDLDARRLMNEIRKAYDLAPVKESLNITVDDLRERYFRGEIFNVGDVVVCENKQCVVVKRGSNHLLLTEEGTDVKFTRWIKDVYLQEDYENPEDHNQVSWQGYTTKHFDLDTSVVDAFNTSIHSGDASAVDILHAMKEVDEYMGHLKAAIATRQASPEVVNNVKVHMDRAREHLAKMGQAEHHDNYLKTHGDHIEKLASDYKEAGKEEMNDSVKVTGTVIENLTNKTLKPSSADQIKAARIIATTLGVDNVEATTNPEQIVNMGLRKIKNKALNAESYEILRRMLKMATDIGIEFDTNLMPQKLKEAYYNKLLSYDTEGRMTEVDTDNDGIPDWLERNMTKVGETLHNEPQNDQLRKQKIHYHLGEANGDPKKLAREVAKAALAAKHAREKETLSKKHEQEKENIKENFKDLHSAMKYASDKVKTHRDPDDGIEIYKHKSGSYDVNHTMNASGRNSLQKLGAKHLGTVRRDNSFNIKHNVKEEFDLSETALNAKDPHGDYKEKSKALHQLSMNKDVDQEHVKQRKLDLEKEYSKYRKEEFDLLEQIAEAIDKGEYDYEGQMARTQLQTTLRNCKDMIEMLKDDDNMPEWVQSKITLAQDYITTVRDYLQSKEELGEDYVQAADQKIGKDGKKHAARLIKIGSDGPGEKRSVGNDRFSEETEEEFTEKDIDDIVNQHKDWEDILDGYDDEELAIVDDETGEELEDSLKEEALNEVLSRLERIKAKTRFARSKSKRMAKAKVALKRSSPQSVINTRARRLAIKAIKQRIAKKPLASLSVAEKERLEQRIAKMKPVLNRIAMKLAPRVRQIEKARLSHSKYTK
jgi:nicotinic acid mononucleotide adenylyltransferase